MRQRWRVVALRIAKLNASFVVSLATAMTGLTIPTDVYSCHSVKQNARKNEHNTTQVQVSQTQPPATPDPSFKRVPSSRTITTSAPSSRPNNHLISTSGPCGLEIYGDINLLDFANLEGLLTPGSESDSTALPSPSQLSNILNMTTSSSAENQMSDHLRASLAEDKQKLTAMSLSSDEMPCSRVSSDGLKPGEAAKDTPVGNFSSHSGVSSHDLSPPIFTSSTGRERVATVKPSTQHSEGNWVGALHIAVQRGHIRILRILLQHGVDCNQKDGEGLTPLIHSIISNHEDVLSSLIQNGARVCETDNHSRNALHWAILQRQEVLLKVLLKYCSGDQIAMERRDSAGRTPLHTAVDIGFEAGVCILLEYGADLNSRAEMH